MLLSRPPKDKRLRPFIEAFWTCEIRDGRGLERVLPNGRTQLFINLHRDALHHYETNGAVRQRASGMVVQGPSLAPIVIDRAERKQLCGVLFSPGGAYPVLGTPVFELGAELVDLVGLGWAGCQSLHERLSKASDAKARLDVLEAACLQRAPAMQHWDSVVGEASHLLRQGWRVQNVANQCNITQQTLITRFRERTGLTPKVFARIERIQRLVRAQSDASSWADASIAAGFSDQSHMVREFKFFSGITPTGYNPIQASELNHLPHVT